MLACIEGEGRLFYIYICIIYTDVDAFFPRGVNPLMLRSWISTEVACTRVLYLISACRWETSCVMVKKMKEKMKKSVLIDLWETSCLGWGLTVKTFLENKSEMYLFSPFVLMSV